MGLGQGFGEDRDEKSRNDVIVAERRHLKNLGLTPAVEKLKGQEGRNHEEEREQGAGAAREPLGFAGERRLNVDGHSGLPGRFANRSAILPAEAQQERELASPEGGSPGGAQLHPLRGMEMKTWRSRLSPGSTPLVSETMRKSTSDAVGFFS